MATIKYHIEQADNGYVLAELSRCPVVEVAHDKDWAYILGKTIAAEIKALMDERLISSVELSVSINPRKSKLTLV